MWKVAFKRAVSACHVIPTDEDRTQRGQVGAAEMQQIVGELAQLKRDLRQWRADTKASKPSWSLLCPLLACCSVCRTLLVLHFGFYCHCVVFLMH